MQNGLLENFIHASSASVEATRKLVQGYSTLAEIDEVKVGATPKELVFRRGKMQLYRYQATAEKTCTTPVLVAYALVNKPYMLDLQPDRSFIRNLLDKGLDVYIIDWGETSRADRYVSMEDYIEGFMYDCVEYLRETHSVGAVNLMGICQGGTFSTIFAALHPEMVKNLVTFVTPIDFDVRDGLLFCWAKDLNPNALADTYGAVPGEVLNTGFELLKPFMGVQKYVSFLDMLSDKDKVMNFLRMEQWIADSPAQAGECYREFITEMYHKNSLIKGEFTLAGKKVSLKNITSPLLNIYAAQDHIVPPSATKPLNDHVGTKDATLYEFPGGHIGVFVSSKTQKELAPKVYSWLKERDK